MITLHEHHLLALLSGKNPSPERHHAAERVISTFNEMTTGQIAQLGRILCQTLRRRITDSEMILVGHERFGRSQEAIAMQARLTVLRKQLAAAEALAEILTWADAEATAPLIAEAVRSRKP